MRRIAKKSIACVNVEVILIQCMHVARQESQPGADCCVNISFSWLNLAKHMHVLFDSAVRPINISTSHLMPEDVPAGAGKPTPCTLLQFDPSGAGAIPMILQ